VHDPILDWHTSQFRVYDYNQVRHQLSIMRLLKAAATGLIALTSVGLVACQKSAPTGEKAASGQTGSVFETGKLRAVVFDDVLPMVDEKDGKYEGLSFVVLDAIRNQLKSATENKSDDIVIEPVSIKSAQDGLNKIRSGEADIACGVAFTWERQRTLTYSLPFATSGVRVLAPKGNDGTPDSLKGKTIGVVKDTAAAAVLAKSVDDAEFQFFSSPKEALEGLKDGTVEFLGGDSLWLKASRQATAPDADLVPTFPYARSSVGCVVADTTPHLLNYSNLAIGRMLTAYVDDNQDVRTAVNKWIGPDSQVGLSENMIGDFFTIVLATTAELSKGS